MKMHFRSTRLYTNSGISFPECYRGEKTLNLEKTALRTTGDLSEVTCIRCWESKVRTLVRNGYPASTISWLLYGCPELEDRDQAFQPFMRHLSKKYCSKKLRKEQEQ